LVEGGRKSSTITNSNQRLQDDPSQEGGKIARSIYWGQNVEKQGGEVKRAQNIRGRWF